MKFGGTSVADSSAIMRVVGIVKTRLEYKPVVVVSALSQVTNILTEISKLAEEGNISDCNVKIKNLRERHIGICSELFGADKKRFSKAQNEISQILKSLIEVIKAISFLREISEKRRAWIIALGEQLSNILIDHALNHNGIACNKIDAREFIITDNNYLKGKADINIIEEKAPPIINSSFQGYSVVLTQGFISSTKNGEPSLLGREGSDLTATLIGNAMEVDFIEIWTDVDGIRTADPRMVDKTRSISEMSFDVAEELSFFGAKVLHPLTIEPARMKNIPVKVLNSKDLSLNGTLILHNESVQNKGIKSVTSKENIIALRVISNKTVSSGDFLEKLFRTLNKSEIIPDIVAISQASVELTFEGQVEIDKLVSELSVFSNVSVDNSRAQITIVGEDLKVTEGIMKIIFEHMENISIELISGGASTNNISFLVGKENLNEILKTLHSKLF